MNGQLSRFVRMGGAVLVAAALIVGLFTVTATDAAARGDRGSQSGQGGQGDQGGRGGQAGQGQVGQAGRGGQGDQGGRGGQALGPLSAAEVEALTEAINEEYLAMNTYRAVIAQFGSTEPFDRIATSEQRHADSLARLFTKYGLTVPPNSGLASTPTWPSVTAACQTGVEAEIADAALYDALEPQVTHSDILRVFGNLKSASLENHLPAFEACN